MELITTVLARRTKTSVPPFLRKTLGEFPLPNTLALEVVQRSNLQHIELLHLRNFIDSGETLVADEVTDLHRVQIVLLFLKELPESLLPRNLSNNLKNRLTPTSLSREIESLPKVNVEVLEFGKSFFWLLLENSELPTDL